MIRKRSKMLNKAKKELTKSANKQVMNEQYVPLATLLKNKTQNSSQSQKVKI